MQRRNLLKTVGGIGAASAAGGLGLIAMSGGAAAEFSGPEEAVTATTDDGDIKYVAYGGHLRFEWDGLDTEATHGEYEVRSCVQRKDSDEFTGWKNHGSDSGPLGDDADADHDGDGEFEHGEGNSANSWGGDNDRNSGPGTNGYWEFYFGSPNGQRDYAIGYDGTPGDNDLDTDEVIPVGDPWGTSRFNSDTDGEQRQTTVKIEKTCRVYDGDPTDEASSVLVEDTATALMTVAIQNEPRSGTSSGSIEGSVGTDE